MVAGRLPFEISDGNLLSLYEKINASDYSIPEEFDNDLKDLIKGKEGESKGD